MDEQTALSYVKGIPTGVVRDMLLNGTPDEILEKAAHWRDCGVRYIVLANVGLMQRSLRKGLAGLAPFLKVVRGLKKL
jgi:phthiodiolone/phenolphthiodiolone dimycocerosates ketoreductase